MSTLTLLMEKGVTVLGWTLLHSLWQGLLIGCLYAFLRNLARHESERYALGVLMLLTLVLCVFGTSWQLWQAMSPTEFPPFVEASIATTSTDVVSTTVTNWLWLEALLPWLVALWISGVGVLSFNLARQYAQLSRLVREGVEELPEWQTTLAQLCKLFAITHPIRLLRSTQVNTPTLIGLLRPVILLPVGMIAGFTPYQIEMILAHELGHIRRWDYLVNLGQIAIETVLFYHPVVHWISRDVRNAREICCDELALSLTKSNPVDYAHLLTELEDLRALEAPALAANGGVLLARIRRIVTLKSPSNDASNTKSGSILLILILGVGMLTAGSLSLWQETYSTTPSVTEHTLSSISLSTFSRLWIDKFSIASQVTTLFIERIKEGNVFLNAHNTNFSSKVSVHPEAEFKNPARVTPIPSLARLRPASSVNSVKRLEITTTSVNNLISPAIDFSFESKPSASKMQVASENKLTHQDDPSAKATSAAIEPHSGAMLTQQDSSPSVISKNVIESQRVCEQRHRLGSHIKQKVCKEKEAALSSNNITSKGDSFATVNSSHSSLLSRNDIGTSSLIKSGFDSGTRVASPYKDPTLTTFARPASSCNRVGC